MSKLQRIDNLLDSASSPNDLSPVSISECVFAPRMRIESLRRFTGHSIVVSDSVGAGG